MSPIKHMDHLNLTVADLDETERFYGALLGFERVEAGAWHGRPWRILRGGDALLCIYAHPELPPAADLSPEQPFRYQGLKHFALRLRDPADFLRRLEGLDVELNYGGKVSWPHSDAWYVTDPNGYEVELVAWHDDTVRFGAA